MRREGKRTFFYEEGAWIRSRACMAGQKESEGPLGNTFDQILEDDLLGQKSWEFAESEMLRRTVELCASKADMSSGDIGALLAGDLNAQIISAGFAARQLGVPFLGLYGACSTMTETLVVGAALVSAGYLKNAMCAASSHFCTAERQYRAPLELGNQRTPTAQWTVTGAGAVMLASGAAAKGAKVCLTHTTCGRVIDLGIADANNMGAAMAPAAADTLCAHLKDLNRSFEDYDLVVTGDLGHHGRDLLIELLRQSGVDVREDRLFDCGCEIFSARQDVHAGGSGCGCAASMLCGYLLPELAAGHLNRIVFMAPGALLSPTTTMQGESIPGVAHAVVLEHREESSGWRC